VNTLIELVLRLAGLVEAEGRVAKQNAVRVALAVCIWALATILLAVALLGLATSVFLGLASVMHPAVALLIVAAMVLVVAVACGLIGRFVLKRRPQHKAVALRP
jgi:hypothetical protein